MYFALIALLTILLLGISFYFRLYHRHNKLLFWVSLTFLCGALLGIELILERVIIPIYLINFETEYIYKAVMYITAFLNTLINTVPYVTILVFFIYYAGHIEFKRKHIALLFMPVVITFFTTNYTLNKIAAMFIAIWGSLYLIAIHWLFITALLKKESMNEKVNHLIISLIFSIPLIIVCIYQFGSSMLSDILLVPIVIFCFTTLLIVMILYGLNKFAGVKSRSSNTVYVGNAVIHHSLKNEIGKLKLNTLNMRKALEHEQYNQINGYLSNLLKTYESIDGIMSKISKAAKDKFNLHLEEVELSSLIQLTLDEHVLPKGIKLVESLQEANVKVDITLMKDCFQNIINNAIDAMVGGGILTINVINQKKYVFIFISDTGMGMNHLQLQNIFQPFYSTKDHSDKHFGLGMYHVKKVVDAHKGKINVKSTSQAGTTVQIRLKKMLGEIV